MTNHYKIVFLFAIICTVLNGCEAQSCLDGVQENFVMTDELAISLSKTELEKIGVDVSKMEPVPYSDDTDKLFARNSFSKNDGYVLWHQKTGKASSGYSVFIRKKGSKIYCDAGKNI